MHFGYHDYDMTRLYLYIHLRDFFNLIHFNSLQAKTGSYNLT